MPKKSLGRRLEVAGKKVINQLEHRAKEGAKALNQAAADLHNVQVNQALHSDRHESQDILNVMFKHEGSISAMVKESQDSVASLQAQFDELTKKAHEIKNNREVVEQLAKARAELNSAQASLDALNALYLQFIQDELLTNAIAEGNAISNAPKESAPKEGAAAAGKPVEYSQEIAEKLAKEAMAKLMALRTASSDALDQATEHYNRIKNSSSVLATALKEIKDKIFILATYEAASIAVNPAANAEAAANVQARSSFDAMQRQLLAAQAEIENLRAAAGLGNNASASLQPALSGPAFIPQAAAHAVAAGAGLPDAATPAPVSASVPAADVSDKRTAGMIGNNN